MNDKNFDPQYEPLLQELLNFVAEFENESQRAVVILGAAKLDTLLEALLIRVLVPSPSGRDELFDTDRPLSTFSAKIELAYRLGLISGALSRAMHLIRKIRNDFAHSASGASLDSGQHKDRVSSLVAPVIKFQEFEEIKTAVNKPATAGLFYTMLALVIGRLQTACHHATEINVKPIDLVPKVWGIKGETKKSETETKKDDKI